MTPWGRWQGNPRFSEEFVTHLETELEQSRLRESETLGALKEMQDKVLDMEKVTGTACGCHAGGPGDRDGLTSGLGDGKCHTSGLQDGDGHVGWPWRWSHQCSGGGKCHMSGLGDGECHTRGLGWCPLSLGIPSATCPRGIPLSLVSPVILPPMPYVCPKLHLEEGDEP